MKKKRKVNSDRFLVKALTWMFAGMLMNTTITITYGLRTVLVTDRSTTLLQLAELGVLVSAPAAPLNQSFTLFLHFYYTNSFGIPNG